MMMANARIPWLVGGLALVLLVLAGALLSGCGLSWGTYSWSDPPERPSSGHSAFAWDPWPPGGSDDRTGYDYEDRSSGGSSGGSSSSSGSSSGGSSSGGSSSGSSGGSSGSGSSGGGGDDSFGDDDDGASVAGLRAE